MTPSNKRAFLCFIKSVYLIMDLKIFEHAYNIEANLKTKFGADSNLSLNVPCLRFGAGTDPPAALDTTVTKNSG